MTFDENISMLSLAFYKVIMICGPILGLALAIGLLNWYISGSNIN